MSSHPWRRSQKGQYHPRNPLDLDDPSFYSSAIERYRDFQDETRLEIIEQIQRGHIFSTPEVETTERALFNLVPFAHVAAAEFGKTPPKPKWRKHKPQQIIPQPKETPEQRTMSNALFEDFLKFVTQYLLENKESQLGE